MNRYIVFGIAVVLVLHGLVHLIGMAAYWQLAELDGVPYKTSLLGGRLPIGHVGMRIFGALFLVAALGFLATAFGAWTEVLWWRPLLVGTALLSLVITALDWKVAHAGTVVDLVVLGAVALSRVL